MADRPESFFERLLRLKRAASPTGESTPAPRPSFRPMAPPIARGSAASGGAPKSTPATAPESAPTGTVRTRAELLSALERAPLGSSIVLGAREFEGPIVVARAVRIEGRGATIGSKVGPVVDVRAPGASIRDVKLAWIGDDGRPPDGVESGLALRVAPGVVVELERVEVRGAVAGLASEQGPCPWRSPTEVDLGALADDGRSVAVIRVETPQGCRVASDKDHFRVAPEALGPGRSEIRVSIIGRFAEGTLLTGRILLTSGPLARVVDLRARIAPGDRIAGPPVAHEPPARTARDAQQPGPPTQPEGRRSEIDPGYWDLIEDI